MNILAYGPPSEDKPYIPITAKFDDGSQIGPDCHMINLESPVQVPDGYWFAVFEDGSIESFPSDSVKEWSAKKASDIISSVVSPTGDPLKRLSVIRAAAALVGVSIPDLLAALSHFKGENLYEAFMHMKAKGGKIS